MKSLNAAQSAQFLANGRGLLSALKIADKMFGFSHSETIGFLNKYSFKDGSFIIYNPQTLIIERVG